MNENMKSKLDSNIEEMMKLEEEFNILKESEREANYLKDELSTQL